MARVPSTVSATSRRPNSNEMRQCSGFGAAFGVRRAPTLSRVSAVLLLLALPYWPALAEPGADGLFAARAPAVVAQATPAPPSGGANPPAGAKATAPAPAPAAGLPPPTADKGKEAGKGRQPEKAKQAGKAQPKAGEKGKAGDKQKAAEKLKTPLATRREETLADCMKYWDKGTHMTTDEWRATCIRQLANEKKARAEIERQAATTKAAEDREARGKAKKRN